MGARSRLPKVGGSRKGRGRRRAVKREGGKRRWEEKGVEARRRERKGKEEGGGGRRRRKEQGDEREKKGGRKGGGGRGGRKSRKEEEEEKGKNTFWGSRVRLVYTCPEPGSARSRPEPYIGVPNQETHTLRPPGELPLRRKPPWWCFGCSPFGSLPFRTRPYPPTLLKKKFVCSLPTPS